MLYNTKTKQQYDYAEKAKLIRVEAMNNTNKVLSKGHNDIRIAFPIDTRPISLSNTMITVKKLHHNKPT